MTPREDADVSEDAAERADRAGGGPGNTDAEAASEERGNGPTADERAVLDELFAVIEDRRDTLPEGSYTASLFTHEKGENKALEKLGEETTEVLLAAKDNDREALAGEAADLLYHLLVVLAMKDMTLADLRRELRERR